MSCIIEASASSGLIGSVGGCVSYLTQSIANSNIDAANAIRGDGRIHAHQLCFTGSAATRARTRTSNAGVGSTIGSSPSKSLTERNSFTRTRQIAHAAKCFSASARSLSFSRPSMYARIRLSIRSQLIAPILLTQYQCFATISNFSDQLVVTSLLPYLITSLHAAPPTGPIPPATPHKPEITTISTHFPNNSKFSQFPRNPVPDTCAAAPPLFSFPATSQSRAGSFSSVRFPPTPSRWSDACPPLQMAFCRPHPNPPSTERRWTSPISGAGGPAANSARESSQCETAK